MAIGPSRGESRPFRRLPVVHTGQPAPFALTAPAYAAAAAGWLAASGALAASASELAGGTIFDGRVVLAAHLVGLVFFPFAVAAAVWQLLPVMLRNDPPTARARPLALVLLAAGPPLAAAIALELDRLAAVCAALVSLGLLLLLSEAAALVRGAPPGKTLAVSRPAVALALAHAAVAFALGAFALADGGPEPLGVPYERFLLLHVSIALVGWLTVLIAAVGRTLVPMLGLAATAGRRRVPAAEAGIAVGLWIYAGGLATGADPAVAAGLVVVLAGLAPVARVFLRVAREGRIGAREGPVAHVVVGLVFAAQAAVLGALGTLDALDRRQAAIAAVLLAGIGWAAGVIVGQLGKLVSLSGWGSWPPGPRPRQEALYPRRLWQLEVALFAVAVEALAVGVLLESAPVALAGATAMVGAALLVVLAVGETLRRVAVGRRVS